MTKKLKSLNGYEIVDEQARERLQTLEETENKGTQLYKHHLRYDIVEVLVSLSGASWIGNDTLVDEYYSYTDAYFWSNDMYFTGIKSHDIAVTGAKDVWLAYIDEEGVLHDVYSFKSETWVDDAFKSIYFDYCDNLEAIFDFLQNNGTLENAQTQTMFKEFTIISTQVEPYTSILSDVRHNVDFVSLMKFVEVVPVDDTVGSEGDYVFGVDYYINDYYVTMYDRKGNECEISDFASEDAKPEPYTPVPIQ